MASTNQDVADQLDALAAQLSGAASSLRGSSSTLASNDALRMQIIKALEDAERTIKEPQDHVLHALPSMAEYPATRLFIKWGVFKMIPVDGTISYAELASKLGADVNLITRFAWILVALGVLKQVGDDRVAHTPRSIIHTSLNPLNAIWKMGFDDHLQSFSAMPRYFDKFGLKEPTGRYKTIYAFAMGEEDSTVWDLMSRGEERMETFSVAMSAMEHAWPTLGSYDLGWAVAKATESADRPLVVDVGGGKGQCLKTIVKTTPGIPMSRCVLEDLPSVLEAVKAGNDAELQGAQLVPLDFHVEQPVKGALVYYIRRCLHDYGDADCIDMLKHISEAMADDSRLLIVEQVMSNPPSPIAAAADMFMALLGGKERTLDNFEKITGQAGLRIKEVFRNPGTDASLIECVKA